MYDFDFDSFLDGRNGNGMNRDYGCHENENSCNMEPGDYYPNDYDYD